MTRFRISVSVALGLLLLGVATVEPSAGANLASNQTSGIHAGKVRQIRPNTDRILFGADSGQRFENNGFISAYDATKTGSPTAAWTLTGGPLKAPVALTVDANGNLWVADYTASEIFEYASPTLSGPPTLAQAFPVKFGGEPLSIAVCDGYLYVATIYEQTAGLIVYQVPSVSPTSKYEVAPSQQYQPNSIGGVACDASGNVWLAYGYNDGSELFPYFARYAPGGISPVSFSTNAPPEPFGSTIAVTASGLLVTYSGAGVSVSSPPADFLYSVNTSNGQDTLSLKTYLIDTGSNSNIATPAFVFSADGSLWNTQSNGFGGSTISEVNPAPPGIEIKQWNLPSIQAESIAYSPPLAL